MSNEISINQEIHPITAKLLNHELSLSDVTLEQFREGRIIYPTMKEAQCKGYEAHHITPRSLQGEVITDDRCIRYTSFEHIVDHYLMAREDSKYILPFTGAMKYLKIKMNSDESIILDRCIEISNLLEEGRKKVGKIASQKNKGRHHSDESKKKIKDNNAHYWQGKTRSIETIEKIKRTESGENAFNYGKKFSDETRLKMSEACKGRQHFLGKHHTEETKEKQRQSKIGNKNPMYGKSLSPDHIDKLINGRNKQIALVKDAYLKYKDSQDYMQNPMSWNQFQKYFKEQLI